MKKTVFFDTNMINPDGSYFINKGVIEGRKIKDGEEITVYQEGEEWDAIVTSNNGIWGAELISTAKEVNEEKRIGYEEGYWEGYYTQQLRIISVLKQMNLSKEDFDFIVNKIEL